MTAPCAKIESIFVLAIFLVMINSFVSAQNSQGAHDLEKCQDPTTVDGVFKGDEETAQLLANCLERISFGKDWESITTAMTARTDDPNLAISVFGEMALKNGDPKTRAGSILALRILDPQGKSSLGAINHGLADSDSKVQRAAIGAVYDPVTKIKVYDQSTVSALTSLLSSPVPEVKLDAIGVLGFIGPDAGAATLALTPFLKGKDTKIASTAAASLARIGPAAAAAIPALMWAVEHRSEIYTWEDDGLPVENSIWALGEIGERASIAVPLLIQTLKRPGMEISSAKALGQIGDPRAIPALQQVFHEPNMDSGGINTSLQDTARTSLQQLHAQP
jgi:HEAT repeat protein